MRTGAVNFEPAPDTVLRGCAGGVVMSLAIWIVIGFFLIRAFL